MLRLVLCPIARSSFEPVIGVSNVVVVLALVLTGAAVGDVYAVLPAGVSAHDDLVGSRGLVSRVAQLGELGRPVDRAVLAEDVLGRHCPAGA